MPIKILQLSKKSPYPLKDGESIAISYLSKALSELGCKISLISMITPKHPVSKDLLKENCLQYTDIHTVEVDNEVKIWDAFVNLFKKESYHISRFISDDFKQKLKEVLLSEKFNIVQLETPYLAPYIPIIRKYSDAKICMRSHNIEHEIWERIAKNTSNPIKKLYLKYLARKLKEFEVENLNEYDFLISVSDRDLKKIINLGYKNEAITSPIGINLEKYTKKNIHNTLSDICFIGALDWMPNKEGLIWFLEKIWPALSSRNPELKFHIAGRNMGEDIKSMASKEVIIHGEVSNAIEFINSYEIMVVPLLSGSGTRVKILEAMSLGKGIVTTSIGKEGIDVKDKKHLFIADTPIEFVSAVETLLMDEYIRITMGKNAEKFVKKNYDHRINAQLILENYQSLV